MKRLTLFFLCGLISCSTFAQSKIPVTRFTLDNGLQVWLHEDHTRPEVFGAVVVNGGAKLDEADATGMAHYLEHMLFKGTTDLGTTDYEKEKIHLDKIDSLYERLGVTTDKDARKTIQLEINEQNKRASEFAVPNEVNRLLTGIGGRGVNAFTSHDMVVYHNTFPPHQAEKWMKLYSHRFVDPVFRMFQSELETVYEEKNRRMDGMESKIFADFQKSFYKQHPYGQRDVLGEVEHLKNPSLLTMYKYFHTYYVPNNMALVLSGDIDAAKLKPIIEEKFGVWKRKDLPEKKVYTETDFNGKEIIRGRYLPIKVGVMGYRTVAIGHEDEAVLEVINNMLSNANETGLWDKLALDNKLMFAGVQNDMEVDYGKTMLFFVPKIVGQSLKKAESMSMEQLDVIRRGEFSDEFLESVKLNLIRNQQLGYESNYTKAIMMAEAFVSDQEWDYVTAKEDRIRAVDRATILKKVNQYFGENKLVLYSKMGLPKKTRLDKPPYTPVAPKGKESAYAKKFNTIEDALAKPQFVDMERDVTVTTVKPLVKIYKAENPINDIFSLQLQYGAGTQLDARLHMLPGMLYSAGAGDMKRDALKTAFSEMGTTCNFYGSNLTFTVNMQGFDHSLEKSAQLIGKLLDHPVFDEKGRKNVVSSEKFERRLEGKDINEKFAMVREYQRYGEQSFYLTRLGISEVKKMPLGELMTALKTVREHELIIFYTGNKSVEEVRAFVEKYLLSVSPMHAEQKDTRTVRTPAASELLFLNDKKAVQSQLGFYINSTVARDVNHQININAFNEYIGGMSGLVFQEIREFRSLAYSATASLSNGSIYGAPAIFNGYIGCQADKSVEAIDAMTAIIKTLPLKPERISGIQKSLLQSSAMARPFFRSMSQTVHSWTKAGYTQDPSIFLTDGYSRLVFDDISRTWEKYVKEKPVSYAVAGNKKRMNLKDLGKYGTVKELSLSDIRKK
jgi:zinc protease